MNAYQQGVWSKFQKRPRRINLRHAVFQTIILAVAAGLYYNVMFDFAWWAALFQFLWNTLGLLVITICWAVLVGIKDEYLKSKQLSPKAQGAMDGLLKLAVPAYSNKLLMVYDVVTDWCLFAALYYVGYTTLATFYAFVLMGQYGVLVGMKQSAREYISHLQPPPGQSPNTPPQTEEEAKEKKKYRSIDDQ